MSSPSNIPREILYQARSEAASFFGIGYYTCTLEGRVLFMDDAALQLLDLHHTYSDGEGVSGLCLDYLLRQPEYTERLELIKRDRCVRGMEWPLRLGDGQVRWLFEDARIVAPSAAMAYFVGDPYIESVLRDVTMRKHKESAFLTDQHKYQDIIEAMHEGFYEMDLDGRLTFFNRRLANIIGEPEQDLLKKETVWRLWDKKTWEEVREAARALRKGKPDLLFDWRLHRSDGKTVLLEVSIGLMRDVEGSPCGFRGLVRDVTDRVAAEEAARLAETRYNDLFEEANDIVYSHDLEGKFTALNKAGERISGFTREEVVRKSVYDLIAPEYRENARQMTMRRIRGEDVGKYEIAMIGKDSQRILLEVSARLILRDGTPVGVQGIARDITERRRMEEQRQRLERQLLHTQKLEGLGVLAGGIAHDFNNLLVGILGNANLASRSLAKDTPEAKHIKRIENAAQRAAELTTQMLAYSGRGAFIVRPLDVARLPGEITALARAGISKKIDFVFDIEEGLPKILGDASQVHQALMNLITNASEAIGDAPGVITLSARRIELDEEAMGQFYYHTKPTPGLYVCLTVRDTGVGMTEEQRSKIFDPFYSTKFTGRGLGLAALLGIVRGHKGAVDVETAPGKGAAFSLYFPVAPVSADGAESRESKSPTDSAVRRWKTHGVALVADDEEAICEVAHEILEQLGMTPLIARDGREAIQRYDEHRKKIRIALIDLMMPHVDGQEVVQHIRKSRPELPIIISSGFSEYDITERFGDKQPTLFLQKPYRALDLMRAVKKILDSD